MDRRQFLTTASQSLIASASFTSVFASSPSLAFSLNSTSSSELLRSLDEIKDPPLRKIAFGSCNNQHDAQNHWDIIAQEKPDLWLWLGDNIYADHKTLEERGKEYQILKDNPYYRHFRLETPIMGTWDDHDYAANNQGNRFQEKIGSQALFMDFLDLPHDHPMRQQEGIYSSETFGPVGQQTKVILLDVRYFRSYPLIQNGCLGEDQWQWLEDQLLNHTADLIFIGSGLHVSSNIAGFGLEGWNQHPEERRRLYHLLEKVEVPVVLLSGDRHMASFSKIKLSSGKIVYEFMSSGLTHASSVPIPDVNLVGRTIGKRNFGVIHIDWSGINPEVVMEVKSTETRKSYQKLNPNFFNDRDNRFVSY